MSLQTLCEKEGTTELKEFDFIGKEGKKHTFYSLGSKKVIWASDRAHAKLAEGKTALYEGDVEKAQKCFKCIQYAECKKEGLPDYDEQGRCNWVPSLMIGDFLQNTLPKSKSFIKRNEMSYRVFCEKEGTTKLEKYDLIGKDGKKHKFFSLGSKKAIWASDRAQQAIEEGKFEGLLYAECKMEELPNYDDKGISNWIPTLLFDDKTSLHINFTNKEMSSGHIYHEKGTLYAHKINKLGSNSFSEIRNISVWFLRDYSDEEKNDLKSKIGDGTHILTTYEQLHAYTYCFGLMHEAKLQRAFKSIPQSMLNTEIEVIDYACGQGIATVCLANFIEENNYATKIRRIALIEPSAIALSRASLLCRKVCPNALINTINLDFNDMRQGLILSTNIRRYHLLSNILDMTCYSISHLAEVIGKFKNRGDIFICVDPWYHNKTKDRRQQEFMELLNGKEIYHGVFNSGELNPDRTWTAQITVFAV